MSRHKYLDVITIRSSQGHSHSHSEPETSDNLPTDLWATPVILPNLEHVAQHIVLSTTVDNRNPWFYPNGKKRINIQNRILRRFDEISSKEEIYQQPIQNVKTRDQKQYQSLYIPSRNEMGSGSVGHDLRPRTATNFKREYMKRESTAPLTSKERGRAYGRGEILLEHSHTGDRGRPSTVLSTTLTLREPLYYSKTQDTELKVLLKSLRDNETQLMHMTFKRY